MIVPFTFPFSPAVNVCVKAIEVNAFTMSRTTHALCAPTAWRLPLGDSNVV